MNLIAAPFAHWLLLIALLISGGLILHAATRIAWFALSQEQLTGWFGASVVVLGFWQMKASIQPGLSFHLLGASALAMIAGRDKALLGLAAVLAADTAYGHGEWASFGLSYLIIAFIPVTLAHALLTWAQRALPANYFIYIFVNCFAASALSMWSVGLLTCGFLAASGAYPLDFLLEEQLPYYFLLGWPEGFSSGIYLTLLVVWRPEWVSTFNDAFYLTHKN
ncbi:energy-coupling factor ABC transporter permease [Iodobacter sp.]|uniref:energy-coupling factor ABC transporter permease n=1 Tax=Iodobacter sp. TaxID=1915058 RepID=UPI0025FDA0D6|nr:energy-coupling factor ABC transporter permease [Iodobacter sp.]